MSDSPKARRQVPSQPGFAPSADIREPRDIQLLRDHHNQPTMQFNDKEPLATVPTMKEARPRGSEPSNAAQRDDSSSSNQFSPPISEQPPRSADDIPRNSAAFPSNLDPMAKAAGKVSGNNWRTRDDDDDQIM